MKIRNNTKKTFVFNKTKIKPNAIGELPEGVAQKLATRSGFSVVEEKKKPKDDSTEKRI